MKKHHSFFLIIAFVLWSNIAHSQVTEGKVIYDISYPESGLDDVTLQMLPSESSTYFKDDKMRIDMKMGMGINNSILVDNSKKDVHVLMDMMGNKMDMYMTEKEIAKELDDEGKYTITKSEETKEIAGYTCNKAVISTKEGSKFNVWYTTKIKIENANWNNQFKSLDGFLMEFRMNQNGLTMEMTARSISLEKVNDAIFAVPDGYKVMSKEDLKKMSKGR